MTMYIARVCVHCISSGHGRGNEQTTCIVRARAGTSMLVLRGPCLLKPIVLV